MAHLLLSGLREAADHPARIIEDDLKPEFRVVAEYLRGHEAEHGVTFVALPNDVALTLMSLLAGTRPTA